MKLFLIPAAWFAIAVYTTGCSSKGSSGSKTFCDTTCLKDTIRFTGDHKLAPYLYITAGNCIADTLTWSYKGMGVERKMGIKDLLNNKVYINSNYIKCTFNDTAYAWLMFNDCLTGRGYQLKIPFNKTTNLERKSSGINSIDPKFSIAENMIAYTDRGNIFVEDMFTGKTAQMTFGKALDIDYDDIHEY
ncbi:MAG: hypothetical protein ACRDEB_04115, partial [Chitinophagaceae bacterium]